MSIEEVIDPSLKDKPVIVGGDIDSRGVVAAVSYAATKFGIHSVMPIARAKRLCSYAIFLRGSHRLYSEYSAKVFEILKSYSPLVEPMSLDEAFVDLTGCGKLHGAPLPIKRIPGIGHKGCAKLNRIGVKSVADLSLLSQELLKKNYDI